MHFDYVWLRDHCRSASCFNAKTNQRNLDTASVDLNIRPAKTRVDDGHLFLTCKSFMVLIAYFLAWHMNDIKLFLAHYSQAKVWIDSSHYDLMI